MRTVIITILVWALLLGFLAGGVKVLASSPQTSGAAGITSLDNINENQRVSRDQLQMKMNR